MDEKMVAALQTAEQGTAMMASLVTTYYKELRGRGLTGKEALELTVGYQDGLIQAFFTGQKG